MGMLNARPCCPTDLLAGVTTRTLTDAALEAVRGIYAQGIATGHTTFETEAPAVEDRKDRWLPAHRWAAASPVSSRAVYAGVAQTSVFPENRASLALHHPPRHLARHRPGRTSTPASPTSPLAHKHEGIGARPPCGDRGNHSGAPSPTAR